jgi:hypothetical protein
MMFKCYYRINKSNNLLIMDEKLEEFDDIIPHEHRVLLKRLYYSEIPFKCISQKDHKMIFNGHMFDLLAKCTWEITFSFVSGVTGSADLSHIPQIFFNEYASRRFINKISFVDIGKLSEADLANGKKIALDKIKRSCMEIFEMEKEIARKKKECEKYRFVYFGTIV